MQAGLLLLPVLYEREELNQEILIRDNQVFPDVLVLLMEHPLGIHNGVRQQVDFVLDVVLDLLVLGELEAEDVPPLAQLCW